MIAVRPERPEDRAAIFAVEQAAFCDHPHSEGAEPHIVDRLRADGDLLCSLVALDGEAVVGHVAFSPAVLANGDGGWWTLGPVAVAPARQGEGIGRALIEAGLAQARSSGAHGVMLLGDPQFYGRFGFVTDTPFTVDGPLAPYLQVCAFGAAIPPTTVGFAPAFSASA